VNVSRDIDGELKSYFEIFYFARDKFCLTNKVDHESEIRGCLNILGGVHATWQGLMDHEEYRYVTPQFSLIDDLIFITCFSLAQPLVDSKIGEIPDSLISEVTHVSLELLELMFTADSNPSDDIARYLENVLHISVMNCGPAWDIANTALNRYATLINDDMVGDNYQTLVNWIGPMVAFAEEANSEHFEGTRVLWANDIFFKENEDFDLDF